MKRLDFFKQLIGAVAAFFTGTQVIKKKKTGELKVRLKLDPGDYSNLRKKITRDFAEEYAQKFDDEILHGSDSKVETDGEPEEWFVEGYKAQGEGA